MPNSTVPSRRRAGAFLVVLFTALSGAVGCSSSGSKAPTKSDPNATLVVWTDAPRQPGFAMFQKTHPDVKMKIETVAQALPKLQLLQKGHQAYPDVIFTGPRIMPALTSSPLNYAADLSKEVPAKIVSGFGHSLDYCRIGGKLYCLRNDVAPTVLWYNKKLMASFGYQVPKTWDEFKQIGLRVAKEHPGYLVGSAGLEMISSYFWPSGCPMTQLVGDNKVKIDMGDSKCRAVADLLDPLIKAGVVSKANSFDPDFVAAGKADKVLMLPDASFFGKFIFEAQYKTPNGEIAAAPMPIWPGDTKSWAGEGGGGAYVVSRTSKNLKGAAEIVTWMSSNIGYQSSEDGQPAYGPAADKWGAQLANDKFYAEDPYPAMKEAAANIRPSYSFTRYDIQTPFGETIVAAAKAGNTIASSYSSFEKEVKQLAEINNYTVAS